MERSQVRGSAVYFSHGLGKAWWVSSGSALSLADTGTPVIACAGPCRRMMVGANRSLNTQLCLFGNLMGKNITKPGKHCFTALLKEVSQLSKMLCSSHTLWLFVSCLFLLNLRIECKPETNFSDFGAKALSDSNNLGLYLWYLKESGYFKVSIVEVKAVKCICGRAEVIWGVSVIWVLV